FSDAVLRQEFPLIEMMNSVNIPGAFWERQDALMMSFWIVSVFSLVSAAVFFSAVLLKDIAGAGKRPVYALFVAITVFALSFLSSDASQAYQLLETSNKIFGTIFMVLLPVALFGFSLGRSKTK
ncbi:MAG: GerAB/ArcD/ProY family transporter, partial [Clostridiales bacterium]|nr:GerAB/ArcD/ProY family transporter [Clostridiales bacterium]